MGKTRNTGFSNNAIQFNSGSISFTSGSTTRMFISASGFVGMGVTGSTNPVRLSVSGTIESLTDSTGEGGQITLRGTTYQYCVDNYNGTGLRIFRENDGTGASGITQMFVSSSGNVGIGTTAPLTKLQFIEVGGPSVVPTLTISQDGDLGLDWVAGALNFYSYDGSSNSKGGIGHIRVAAEAAYNTGYTPSYMAFYTHPNSANNNTVLGAATEKMRITAAGNVGIGTSSPAVHGNAGYTTLTIQSAGTNRGWLEIGTATASSSGNIFGQISGFNGTNARAGEVRFFDDGATNKAGIEFAILNSGTITPAMRITSAGYLYLNATSNPLPSNATPQFAVVGGAGTDAVAIKHTVDGNNTLNIWQTGTTQHNAIAFYKGDSQTNRGNIVVNTSGTSYNSSSDYRLKENIVPLENGLARLMQLKPSKFNWIETGEETEGFIAHEVQEIFPYAVTGEKDAVYTSTGNIKPQAVDYGRITPLLVKAIQELKAENDALKTRIETLENK